MSYSNQNRNQPPRAIRAGLSVQELKAMTAARMASSGDSARSQVLQYNPATSYQTANPQQLQAAGITPVVINDRTRGLRNYRPSSLSVIELESNVDTARQHSNGINLPQPNSRPVPQLSPYHQQLLPRRSPPNDVTSNRDLYYPVNDNNNNNNNTRRYDAAESQVWNQRLVNGEYNGIHGTNPATDERNFSIGRRDEASFQNYDAQSDLKARTPSGLLPALNSTPRYVRGPEVRSPASKERIAVPDEESEHYLVESLFSGLNLGSADPIAFTPKRAPLSRAMSNPSIQSETGNFTLPHAGSHVISSGLLPSVSPNAGNLNNTINGHLHEACRSETFLFEESLNDVSPNSKVSEKSPFPFKKSKTAPKLAVLSSGISSPVESPNLKVFARKHAGYPVNLSPLKDRTVVDSNFLASEVAEAVLDTPSTGSTPFGRKILVQSDHLPLRRGLSNSSIQPIDLTTDKAFFANGAFFSDISRDTRLDWSVADGVDEAQQPLQSYVSNQCESEDSKERVPDPSLFPDSANNSPRHFLSSRVNHLTPFE